MKLEQIIDEYCLAWSEGDEDKREKLLAKVLVTDATYTDPTVQTDNLKELSTHIGKVLIDRPGAKVLRTSRVDLHHSSGRFSWYLQKPDGTTLPEGLDVITLDSGTGKIKSILGFFGPLKT